ncbi:MAG: hypothetical protein O3C21_06450 [Verrucomicrobia bacterium]|nr:hypothetical protein [Verrucomicrobiota bacterium]
MQLTDNQYSNFCRIFGHATSGLALFVATVPDSDAALGDENLWITEVGAKFKSSRSH